MNKGEKMSVCEIHLKTLSPIAITKRVFGILYEAEIFIPSWTMWNAFVKLYVLENTKGDKIDYTTYTTAQNVLKNIRLTNFYMLRDGNIIDPFGNNKIDERNFISSDLKTAIDAKSNTSLEGALYEREYLRAKEFVGWGKFKDSKKLKIFFNDKIKNKIIFIGADKNTGFGKVKIDKIITDENEFINNEKLNKIKVAGFDDKRYLHLLPPEVNEEYFFPLVLRMWDNTKGSGEKIEYYGLNPDASG